MGRLAELRLHAGYSVGAAYACSGPNGGNLRGLVALGATAEDFERPHHRSDRRRRGVTLALGIFDRRA